MEKKRWGNKKFKKGESMLLRRVGALKGGL